LEQFFDLLRQDAQTQLERARQPVLRKIISDRKAKIIMRKSLVMSSASGLDVTTEFIEQLDAALPTVDLPRLNQPAAQDNSSEATPDEGGQ
jgi:ABC-type Fe2+-enterobactin transport system substrate-binding protein